nr:MAG TPA: repressor domain protein [Caudoviricetes sp.]
MNDLINFSFEGKGIRTLLIDTVPYFVGKDVAQVLGYKDTVNALKTHVDPEDKKGWRITTPSRGEQKITLINESGVYSLIFGSKLPKAKSFKRWVTSEVLPSLRQRGTYSINQNKDAEDGNRVVIENMIELSKNLLTLTQSTTEICQYLAMVIKESKLENKKKAEETQKEVVIDYSKCKLDQFPDEIKKTVNAMMEEMIYQEKLNFSSIARYCVVAGYPISSPAVKSYYEKHYKEQ